MLNTKQQLITSRELLSNDQWTFANWTTGIKMGLSIYISVASTALTGAISQMCVPSPPHPSPYHHNSAQALLKTKAGQLSV